VDEVRARVEKAVQGKVEGQEIVMTEEPQPGAQVIDLMEALRASLEKKSSAKPKAAPAAEGRKPPKRAATETVAAAATPRKAAKKT
jgi:DNA end-binding protein Ku